MELQSFSLKLSELKEYDQVKAERQEGPNKEDQTMQQSPVDKAIVKGQKTKQEIHTRIGLNMNATT